jgi:uncharacterized membrane protein
MQTLSTPHTITRPRRLSRRARQTLLAIHVVGSVGLLGATASMLVLALSAAGSGDAASAHATYDLMNLQSLVFGIPLSFLSLISGVVIGLGTNWGILRHWWITAKLLLIVGVIVNGALGIGPAVDELRHGAGAGTETRLVAAAALSVAMLLTATTLSVFKPGGRLRGRAARRRER